MFWAYNHFHWLQRESVVSMQYLGLLKHSVKHELIQGLWFSVSSGVNQEEKWLNVQMNQCFKNSASVMWWRLDCSVWEWERYDSAILKKCYTTSSSCSNSSKCSCNPVCAWMGGISDEGHITGTGIRFGGELNSWPFCLSVHQSRKEKTNINEVPGQISYLVHGNSKPNDGGYGWIQWIIYNQLVNQLPFFFSNAT